MGIFIAIKSKKYNMRGKMERLLDEEVLEQNLHIISNDKDVYFTDNGSACLVNFSSTTPIVLREKGQFFSDSRGAIALHGNIIKQEKEIKSLSFLNAKELYSILEKNTNSDIWFKEQYTGDYSYCKVEDNGRITASTDVMTFEHLYYSEDENNIYISNRIRLIRCVMDNAEIDLKSLAYIPYVGNIVGDSTSIKGIKRLKQKQRIVVENNKIHIEGKEYFILEDIAKGIDNEEQYIRDNLNVCINQLNAAINSVSSIEFPITGGRDSRAIFALLMQTGQMDKIKLYTFGFENHPDVIIGREIAEHYKVDWEFRQRQKPTEFTWQDIFENLMIHVFQSDGCLGGWDANGCCVSDDAIYMPGHASEGFKQWFDICEFAKSKEDAANVNRYIQSKFEYINPNLTPELDKYFYERAEILEEKGIEYSVIADSYKITDRLPNWQGYINRILSYCNSNFMILNNENLMKFAYTIGKDSRKVLRTHYEIIRSADKWLAELHFSQHGWEKELGKYIKDETDISNAPLQIPSGIPFYGSWQWKINSSFGVREKFWELLTSFDNSPIWDYFDKRLVEKSVLTKQFDSRDLLNIYSIITIFMYFHKIELPVKMYPMNSDVDFISRIKTANRKIIITQHKKYDIENNRILDVKDYKPNLILENAQTKHIKPFSENKYYFECDKNIEKFIKLDRKTDLSYETDISKYVKKLDNESFIVFICGRWENLRGLTGKPSLLELLERLNYTLNDLDSGEGNLISIIDGNSIVNNLLSDGTSISYACSVNDMRVKITCASKSNGDEGYIIINNIYYRAHCTGITFVVYDKIIGEIADYVTYNPITTYMVRYQGWGNKKYDETFEKDENKPVKELEVVSQMSKKLEVEIENNKKLISLYEREIENNKKLILDNQKEIEKINKENNRYKRRINDYEESTSLKVGRIITAVPRKCKMKLSKIKKYK